MTVLFRMGSIRSTKKREMEFDIFDSPLTDEWIDEMHGKTKILWDIESIHTPWWAAHENFNELRQFIDNQEQDLNTWTEIFLISNSCQNSLKKVNQLVTNCIVSFTNFITICGIHVKKNYGNNHDIFLEWNKKRQLLHKDSFHYRLSYELRNYSQHYSVPISGMELNMTGDRVKGINVYVHTDTLRKSGYNWGNLSNDLNFKEPCAINIIEMLIEYLRCVDQIYKNTLIIHEDKLNSCSSYFKSMIEKYELTEDKHPVVFKGKNQAPRTPPENKEFIPLYLFKRLTHDWLKILNYRIAADF
ncbi:hypothetical protein [Raoultella terrigena]|uniref:hypothetical protein n=1 Tax=Raoultella terrigena TaxID=577 RepID=UPI0015BE0684|nr:hypothetical protein [Raoultella terrigena]NWK89653.1 hypothetical protein [Raoultella terrigena]